MIDIRSFPFRCLSGSIVVGSRLPGPLCVTRSGPPDPGTLALMLMSPPQPVGVPPMPRPREWHRLSRAGGFLPVTLRSVRTVSRSSSRSRNRICSLTMTRRPTVDPDPARTRPEFHVRCPKAPLVHPCRSVVPSSGRAQAHRRRRHGAHRPRCSREPERYLDRTRQRRLLGRGRSLDHLAGPIRCSRSTRTPSAASRKPSRCTAPATLRAAPRHRSAISSSSCGVR